MVLVGDKVYVFGLGARGGLRERVGCGGQGCDVASEVCGRRGPGVGATGASRLTQSTASAGRGRHARRPARRLPSTSLHRYIATQTIVPSPFR